MYDPLNRLVRVCQTLTDDASGSACSSASDVSPNATGITATERLAAYAYDDLGHQARKAARMSRLRLEMEN